MLCTAPYFLLIVETLSHDMRVATTQGGCGPKWGADGSGHSRARSMMSSGAGPACAGPPPRLAEPSACLNPTAASKRCSSVQKKSSWSLLSI